MHFFKGGMSEPFPRDFSDSNSYKVNCGGHSGAYIHWSDSGVLHGNHLWSTWRPEGIWPSSNTVYMHPRRHGFHWLRIFVCIELEIESQQMRGCTWETFLFSSCINIHLWPDKKRHHNYRFKNEKQTGQRSAKVRGHFWYFYDQKDMSVHALCMEHEIRGSF